MHCMREESGKEIFLVADIESLKKCGRVRNLCSVTQCKRHHHAEKWWKLHIPDRRWNREIVWTRPWNPKIHLNSGLPCTRRRARRWSSMRIGRVSTIRHANRWRWSQKRFFLTIAGNYIIRHHVNTMCRMKDHSQYHPSTLKLSGGPIQHWMCCWKAVLTITGTLMVDRNYRSHGPVSRSSQYWLEILQTDTRGPGGRWQQFKQHLGPAIWSSMSTAAQHEEKQHWAIEKPKHDNARQLRSIYFIDPDDMEFKDTVKNASKKVRVVHGIRHALQGSKPWPQEKPVTKTNPILADQNMHASWRPTNLRESAPERLNKKIVKITLLGSGSIRWVITILYTSLFLCSKQWKSQTQKQLLAKSGKTWTYVSMANNESQAQKRGHPRGTEWGKDSSCCYAHGRMPPQELGSGAEVPKNREDVLYSSETLWKTILAFVQYLRSKVRQRHKWRPERLWMLLEVYQDVQDKQPTQCPLTPKS